MKNLTVCVAALLLPLFAISQSDIEAVTKDGKSVILKSDGSWVFSQLSTDSAITFTCSDVVEKSIDDVTGKTLISTKETLIISKDGGKKGFGILLLLVGEDKGTIAWSIKAVGSGCIDENTKINILFKDGSRLEFGANNSFNCKGDATVYLSNKSKATELEQLKSKQIDKLRVWAKSGYVEEQFSEAQAEKLRKSFSCIESLR
jgi:hypothetical protein